MFGFGFVQFTDVSAASKAIQQMNTKPILGIIILLIQLNCITCLLGTFMQLTGLCKYPKIPKAPVNIRAYTPTKSPKWFKKCNITKNTHKILY